MSLIPLLYTCVCLSLSLCLLFPCNILVCVSLCLYVSYSLVIYSCVSVSVTEVAPELVGKNKMELFVFDIQKQAVSMHQPLARVLAG